MNCTSFSLKAQSTMNIELLIVKKLREIIITAIKSYIQFWFDKHSVTLPEDHLLNGKKLRYPQLMKNLPISQLN